MASVLQQYHQLADRMATQITGSYQSWTDFLTTAARLYKYPYHEQLMIYAQRPEATACADYELWNKRMGRYVRRGAKGIALIDHSGDTPKLKYVFDVAGTRTTERSRSPYLWEFHPEHEQAVSDSLELQYDIRYPGSFSDLLEQISSVKVTEYFLAHQQDILDIVDGSYLEQYHDYDKGVAFLNAATASTTYMLLSRCGLAENAHFAPEDFMPVFDFNTPQTVDALGSAISGISEEILRNIEVTIKKYEREKLSERSQENERTDLHSQRGLLDSQPDSVPAGEHAPGQVRENAEEVSTGASPGAVEPPDPVGAAVSPSAGDRRDGEQAVGADDAHTDAVGRSDGSSESQRPHEMGGADEQPESPGRGSDPDGADLHLTEDSPVEQFSFFPTEAQQIESITEAERVQATPSAFSMFISQADIDHILRTGGNADDARMKIVTEFSKQKPVEDRAAFLKALYHGGNGLITENGKISAWYSEDGIYIASGDTARYLPSAQVISWADAAGRTEELLDSGTFATNLEVAEAPRNERQRIAAEVWGLYHDLSDEAKSLGHLPCLSNIRSTNYPEETERLTDELANPAFREILLTESWAFVDAYRENRELLRFHYHRPQALLTRLEELSLPRKEYHSNMAALPGTGKFITEDEIADSLANGSSFEGGKNRIYAFFQNQHSLKEKADFLKEEYGTGGRSHAVSGESGSFEEHGSKGIVLKKSDCTDIQMNWNKAASRISELIRLNRYFTPDEQVLYDEKLAQATARTIAYNSYNAVKESNLAATLPTVSLFYDWYAEVKSQYPDAIVLIKLNGGYLSFQADTQFAATLLGLEVVQREHLGEPKRVSVCYLPNEVVEEYLDRLGEKNKTVVLADRQPGKDDIDILQIAPQPTRHIDEPSQEHPPVVPTDIPPIREITQAELNTLYDSFTEKYGILNSRGNRLAFSDDSAYYLLCALEILDDDGNFQRKADMFSKRTIQPHKVVTSVDTAVDALTISIGERACVDLGYMSSLSGESINELTADLQGVIFHDPKRGALEDDAGWVTADEYLSGNVRQKLKEAEAAAAENPMYQSNVDALRAAQPKDLEASEIEVRLGATWIDKAYIQQFMYELLDTPYYLRRSIHVEYSPYTAAWNISNKRNISGNDVAAWNTYGTDYVSAYDILEDSLNLRDVRVYDTVEDEHGKPKRVLNGKQTTLAQQKQQLIRDAFKDWIWADPTRRQTLVEQYNREMNSIRPREYDGSHIVFAGMNPEIRLREHQRNAIAHVLYGGNTLLAHEVGAGKTFEMVGAAMEAKRLGLCRKSLFVVPNHLTEQWASEFLRLYPSANILVTKQKDFETRNRKKFCARIATGDYDAVIIGHSQFEKIPISQERQEALLEDQIEEITLGISELRSNNAERFSIKQLERAKRSLEARLEKLQANDKKDDVVTFEELGVDRLFVDEAHSYKNLFLYTKMQNVAGLSTSDAQKSSDMFAKCRYMDELTGGRGVIFATGTPVSNSMTELYTMQRYLQYDRLQEMGMIHFDCWASRFGETVTALELAPEGKGYRPRTRFSRFFNLPELMNIFREVADIKTADQLHLPVPEVEYHNVAAKPSEVQKELVQELSERAALIHSGSVSPDIDNMLKITSDGRKLGLDQRIINPAFPDDPESKVNLCVGNILQVWRDSEADKLTQLVFCDVSTPQAAVKAKSTVIDPLGGIAKPFTVYEDIRSKLIAQGVPPEQIAFIHDANSEAKKKELFGKVRSGQVRVLLGSTAKMGAGTNVQDRLVAIHDLDCPWRPGDLAQRKGRIERQGNQNEKVHVFRYVTEGTFDAYLWQTVENKQKFISQIMSSKNPVRSCEDVDEVALSFAEIKALCAGDPRIKERMDLDVDVARLKIMKADYKTKQFRLEDSLIRSFPAEIAKMKEQMESLKADMQTLSEHPHPEGGFAGMTVLSDTLLERENAGAALIEAAKQATGRDPVEIGTYRGFTMSVTLENFGKKYVLTMQGKFRHPAELGSDPKGNLIRLDNALAQMPQRMQSLQTHLEETYHQQEAAKAELEKPWPYEQELRDKTARLIFLDAELNLDTRGQSEPEQVIPKSSRPSILSRLKSAPPQSKNPKPKKHHEEVR